MNGRDVVGRLIGVRVVVLDEIGGSDPLTDLVVFDVRQRTLDGGVFR